MLVGARVLNFDVFDDDKCGLILEDYLKAGAGNKPAGLCLISMLLSEGTGQVRRVTSRL